MPSRRTHVAFAAFLALAASCDDSIVAPVRSKQLVAQDSAAQFRTDSSTYTITTGGQVTTGRIRATLTNRSGRTMYFVNCNGATSMSIQRLDGEKWTPFWSPILPLCLSSPIVIPNERTYTFDMPIFAGKAGSNNYPQFDSPLRTGLYRVIWHDAYFSYQDRLPWGEPIPESQRVSNSFVINAP